VATLPPVPPPPASTADVLSVAEVARRLGMRREDVALWLRERRLVFDVAGRSRVVWGDVLDALRGPAEGPLRPLRLARL